MLHTGGGWGETPHMIVKRFGCTAIQNKALYKSLIHSFIHSTFLLNLGWYLKLYIYHYSYHPWCEQVFTLCVSPLLRVTEAGVIFMWYIWHCWLVLSTFKPKSPFKPKSFNSGSHLWNVSQAAISVMQVQLLFLWIGKHQTTSAMFLLSCDLPASVMALLFTNPLP